MSVVALARNTGIDVARGDGDGESVCDGASDGVPKLLADGGAVANAVALVQTESDGDTVPEREALVQTEAELKALPRDEKLTDSTGENVARCVPAIDSTGVGDCAALEPGDAVHGTDSEAASDADKDGDTVTVTDGEREVDDRGDALPAPVAVLVCSNDTVGDGDGELDAAGVYE